MSFLRRRCATRLSVRLGDPENLTGRTQTLEDLAVELYARGLSTRDIEDAFTDESGRRLLSRAAVSEITERLWAEYEAFIKRDLSEYRIVYLYVDGIAERLRAGQPREAVIAAWAIGEDGRKVLLHLMAIPPTFFQQICSLTGRIGYRVM